MHIPLSHFEQYIDESILSRGLSYFRNGHVTTFEALSPDEFEAIVQGTEDYRVILKIQGDSINEYSCTCPYDYGSVCKHIAAAFFYMQQEELNLKPAEITM